MPAQPGVLPPSLPAVSVPKHYVKPETAIVPAHQPQAGGLSVVRKENDPAGSCPMCGATWSQFKQGGVMGCPHDYAHFESKILPLVKRAQEGAVQHTGKVPTKIEHTEMTREVTTTRLRRELQKAIHAERYEDAARLRDALSKMGFATS
jgi:protein-arginine kinase activator protein McsA